MRIAFVGTNDPRLDRYPPGGGIEYQVWSQARRMARDGHDVHILTRFRGKPSYSQEEVTMHGVPSGVPTSGMSALWFSLNACKILRRLEPDVIYLSEKLTSYFVSKMAYPKLYYTHNKDTFLDYRENLRPNPLKVALACAIENRVMTRSSLVCCPTEGYRKELAERGFTNTTVIPPGVEIDDYRDSGDCKFVFFSGQLHRVKGVRYLLEAFAVIHPQFPDHRLVIGGEGPEEHRLRTLARKLSMAKHVEFRPWISRAEVLHQFATCTVYVLPSLSESFGIVALEAMASKKPVIASDVSGPRDVIRHGKDGYLFEPGERDQLACYLEELLVDPRRRARMGASGRRRVEEKFNMDAICKNLSEIISGVMA